MTRHPTKYTDALLPVFAEMLTGATRVLNPFAGTGKVFALQPALLNTQIAGIEIEFEPQKWRHVICPGNQRGANHHLRVEFESVILFHLNHPRRACRMNLQGRQ